MISSRRHEQCRAARTTGDVEHVGGRIEAKEFEEAAVLVSGEPRVLADLLAECLSSDGGLAKALPQDAWLSLNASPDLVLQFG